MIAKILSLSAVGLGSLSLVSSAPTTILPRWFTCETSALSPPPNVSTPLSAISSLGSYTPFISQNSSLCRNLPDGYSIDKVIIVSRHGSRSPTSSALAKIKTSVNKLSNVSVADDSWKFVEDYKVQGYTADALTDYGRKELYDSGKTYAERYSSLASEYFVRSSGEDRVVESSQYFLQGFLGQDFKIENTTLLPYPAVVISEDDGFNNTLAVSNCPAYNNEAPDPEGTAQNNWLATYTPAIIDRLASILPGANITGTDILAFQSLCGFEAIKNLTYATSPWCDVFTDEEWKQNDYYFDAEKWYGHSYGNPYTAAQYAGWVNEILARLTETPVLEGGATNTTLDESSATFPLDKTFYAEFSHDNDMVSLLAALGIWKEADLPTTPDPTDIPSHTFVVHKLVPFAGRFVFERLVSPQGVKYVRVIVNDAVAPLDFQDCGVFGAYGMCELDAFVAKQWYAQARPSYFDQLCYGPQVNATVV